MRAGVDAWPVPLGGVLRGRPGAVTSSWAWPRSGRPASRTRWRRWGPAAATGFKGVVISCWPSGEESISDADDVFWAAAAEAGLGVHPHRVDRLGPHRIAARSAPRAIYGANAKAVSGLSGVFSVVPNIIEGSSSSPACSSGSRRCRWR